MRRTWTSLDPKPNAVWPSSSVLTPVMLMTESAPAAITRVLKESDGVAAAPKENTGGWPAPSACAELCPSGFTASTNAL